MLSVFEDPRDLIDFLEPFSSTTKPRELVDQINFLKTDSTLESTTQNTKRNDFVGAQHVRMHPSLKPEVIALIPLGRATGK